MSIQRISAWGGSELIADTTARTGRGITSFICQEATVISVLAGGKKGLTSTNYLTTMGLSGKTLAANALIIVPNDEYIANITLTSGSIIAYSA